MALGFNLTDFPDTDFAVLDADNSGAISKSCEFHYRLLLLCTGVVLIAAALNKRAAICRDCFTSVHH
jgi:hypothetical protein